jgi:hypothetical protein
VVGLEEAAKLAERRDAGSKLANRLRGAADVAGGFAKGPLADKLRRRERTTVTWGEPEPLEPKPTTATGTTSATGAGTTSTTAGPTRTGTTGSA